MSIKFTKAALALSVAASFGVANAATIATNVSSAKTAVSLEQSQVAASVADARLPIVTVTTGKNLVAGNSINVTLSQGSFENTTYFLTPVSALLGANKDSKVIIAASATNSAANRDVFVGGNPVGRQVSFTVNGGKSVNAGTKFIFHSSTTLGANGLPKHFHAANGLYHADGLQANTASLTSAGAKVTLTVDDGASAAAATAFVATQQFSAKVSPALDATIDVVDGRKTFLNKAKSDSLTVDVTDAQANFNQTSTKYNAAADKFVVTLFGNMGQIKSVTDGSNTYKINSAKDAAAFTYTGFADRTITVAVSGTQALNADTFTASMTGDLTGTPDVTLLSKAAAGAWKINGLQAKVSNMTLNATGFISWLKVVNESAQDASMEIDAFYTKADGTVGKVTGKALNNTTGTAVAKAGQIVTVGQAQILEAIGMTSTDGIIDVSATVTVIGPVNSVNVVAEKKAPDGRVSIPVYYNKDSRAWVQ